MLDGIIELERTMLIFLGSLYRIPLENVPPSIALTTYQFLEIAKDIISQCRSDGYVIATQPGVHASDFRSGHAGAMKDGRTMETVGMPHLKRALHEVPGNLVVPYARSMPGHDDADDGGGSGSLGGQTAMKLGEWARDKCGAELVEVDASSMLPLLCFLPSFNSSNLRTIWINDHIYWK